MNEKISKLLTDIRSYRDNNADLQEAHHFIFCKPIIRNKNAKNLIVMGINPGETTADRISTNGNPSEETFEFDFHEGNRSAASKKWMSNIDFFLPDHNIFLTELFFWSSKDVKHLTERYGKIQPENQHIQFCKEKNLALIDLIRPDAIIFTGITYLKTVASIYNLNLKVELFKNKRLAVQASSDSCPWVFTRHWSGSFGFSKSDKNEIKNFISKIIKAP